MSSYSGRPVAVVMVAAAWQQAELSRWSQDYAILNKAWFASVAKWMIGRVRPLCPQIAATKLTTIKLADSGDLGRLFRIVTNLCDLNKVHFTSAAEWMIGRVRPLRPQSSRRNSLQ